MIPTGTPTPEVWFYRNTLHLRQGHGRTLRIHTWPDLGASWEATRFDGPRAHEPATRFVTNAPQATLRTLAGLLDSNTPGLRGLTGLAAWGRFLETIPLPVQRLTAPVHTAQWRLLRLLAADDDAVLLAEHNLGLAYAVAVTCDDLLLPAPMRDASVKTLLRLSRADLLSTLGFDHPRRTARMLGKLDPSVLAPENIRLLRQISRNQDQLQTLGHLPAINTGALAVIADGRLDAVRPSLLHEIATAPAERFASVAHIQLLEVLHESRDDPRAIARLRTRAELERFLEATLRLRAARLAAEKAEHAEAQRRHAEAFPRPPLRGTSVIQPITTADALRAEGHSQDHCCGSYVNAVASGHAYFYRVLGPERATLQIVRSRIHREVLWVIGECNLAWNKRPSHGTQQAVRSWLDDRQQTAPLSTGQ